FISSGLVKGAIALLGSAFSLLSGPVGIVIAAIGMLAIALVAAYNEIEWFRNIVNTAWMFISTFIQERVALIIETFNSFREEGQGIFEALWNTIVTIISERLNQTYNSNIQRIVNVITTIVAWVMQYYSTLKSYFTQFSLFITI